MLERLRSHWIKRKNRQVTSLTGVAVRADGGSVNVHMTNLSYYGCHLVTDRDLEMSEIITLVIPRMPDLEAQVRWVGEREAGVRFLHRATSSAQSNLSF
jgi:hypothetical protein